MARWTNSYSARAVILDGRIVIFTFTYDFTLMLGQVGHGSWSQHFPLSNKRVITEYRIQDVFSLRSE